MNKSVLAESIASEQNISNATATEIVDLVIDMISSALRKGDHVTLSGFGTFSTYQRKQRNGRNPQTGAPLKIAARRVAKFTPGVELKKAVGRK